MGKFLDLFRRRQTAADAAPPLVISPSRAQADDAFVNSWAGLGTGPDKRIANAYCPVTFMTQIDCNNYYSGDWVMAKAVNAPVEDMLGNWFNLVWPDKAKDEKDATTIADTEDALGIRERVTEGMIWGRLNGGAALVMVIAGEDDWSLPLGYRKGANVRPGTQPNYDAIQKDSLDLVYPVDRWRLSPEGMTDSTVRDPITGAPNPNFGKPVSFMLTDESMFQSSFRIHWSRLVLFHGRRLPRYDWWRNGRWHASVLQCLQDDVKDYAAQRASIATLGLEQSVDILAIPGLAETLGTPGGMNKVINRVAFGTQMKGLNRVWLIDGGNKIAGREPETYQQKRIDFSGAAAALSEWQSVVAGATGIPITKFFGRSPGGLNATGDSDMKNYVKTCKSDQATQLRPAMLTLYQVLIRSAIGRMPDDVKIVFPPIDDPSRSEQADVEVKDATRDKTYVDMGVPLGVVMRQMKEKGAPYALTDADVDAASELDQQDRELAVAGAKAQAKAFAKGEVPGAPAKKPPAK